MSVAFYLGQLDQFVGWTVDTLAQSPEDEFGDQYFGLVLKNGKARKIVWFLRDDEGNGPGSFDIEDVK